MDLVTDMRDEIKRPKNLRILDEDEEECCLNCYFCSLGDCIHPKVAPRIGWDSYELPTLKRIICDDFTLRPEEMSRGATAWLLDEWHLFDELEDDYLIEIKDARQEGNPIIARIVPDSHCNVIRTLHKNTKDTPDFLILPRSKWHGFGSKYVQYDRENDGVYKAITVMTIIISKIEWAILIWGLIHLCLNNTK